MKHVELDFHFVYEKVQEKKLIVQHIPSIEQPIYILTKAIPVSLFIPLCKILSIILMLVSFIYLFF